MTVRFRISLACLLLLLCAPLSVPAQTADPAETPPATGSTLFRANPGKPDAAETATKPTGESDSVATADGPVASGAEDAAAETPSDAPDSPAAPVEADAETQEEDPAESASSETPDASPDGAGETSPESGDRTLSVTVDAGNVREEPSLAAEVVARVNKEDAVRVLAEEGDWFRIRTGEDVEGWAHKGLFGEAELPARTGEGGIRPGDDLTVRVGTGNLRKEPSLDAPVVDQLASGETVTVTEVRADWFAVRTAEGVEGWTHWTLYRGKKAAAIQAIRIERTRTGEEKVHFLYDGTAAPTVFLLDTTEYPRLVCDFEKTALGPDIPEETAVSGRLIWQIRSARRGPLRTSARVVLDLAPDKIYEFQHFFVEGQLYTLIVAAD